MLRLFRHLFVVNLNPESCRAKPTGILALHRHNRGPHSPGARLRKNEIISNILLNEQTGNNFGKRTAHHDDLLAAVALK